MRQLLSTCTARGDAEPMVELAVRALPAVDERRATPAVTGVMPIGVWQ